MENDGPPISRRRVLGAATGVSFVGLAGCLTLTGTTDPPAEAPDDRDEPLPDGLETCESIDGIERDPDELQAKEDVGYQFHPAYTGGSGFIEMCANCRFFCPGRESAPVGGCTEVEGGIRSQDWCALWQPHEGLEERERSGGRRG